MSQNRIGFIAGSALGAVAFSLFPLKTIYAAPQGGQIVGGTASISTTGSTTHINQTTNRAAINWQSFNVDTNETVKFTVPTNGATLNRVIGNAASTIKGTVTSNGTLLLVNPNGMVFNAGSTVTAQNFIASTGDINPTKFMTGNKIPYVKSTTNAKIDLRGNITVSDRGVIGIFSSIDANSSPVGLRASQVILGGEKITAIDLDGNGLMTFEVSLSGIGGGDININPSNLNLPSGTIIIEGNLTPNKSISNNQNSSNLPDLHGGTTLTTVTHGNENGKNGFYDPSVPKGTTSVSVTISNESVPVPPTPSLDRPVVTSKDFRISYSGSTDVITNYSSYIPQTISVTGLTPIAASNISVTTSTNFDSASGLYKTVVTLVTPGNHHRNSLSIQKVDFSPIAASNGTSTPQIQLNVSLPSSGINTSTANFGGSTPLSK